MIDRDGIYAFCASLVGLVLALFTIPILLILLPFAWCYSMIFEGGMK